MQTGFNTDIEYQKMIFHVQTEDSGPDNPVMITHLFYKGAILSSKKTNYSEILNSKTDPEKLKELMKKQHEEMIAFLLRGDCNHLIGGGVSNSKKNKTLDDYIDAHIKNKT
ncbi:MAG: hypothetical protein HYR81_01540 [Nitrospirae bacterium]|nr:hypothetical protein [Nitrospirota bacterium]